MTLWTVGILTILLLLIVKKNWRSSGQELEQPLGRAYRQTKEQYTVELFMVVDYAAYKWWYGLSAGSIDREKDTLSTIKQYYSYVFNGIDQRFRSIDNQPFEIDMSFVGIYVAKSESDSDWTSGSAVEGAKQVRGERLMVNSSEALEKFQIWIDETPELPSFDHAVLFTGTNLTYAGIPGNTGLAFASSMCRNISNSSIVEDSFDFRTITYATQQIARSLGASDDMDNNDCLEFFNYIMTPKFKLPNKSFPSNRWRFSTCSLVYFQEYLDRLNIDNLNCLGLSIGDAQNYPSYVDSLTQELPGNTYIADQQCKHTFGLDSYACRDVIKADYTKVCYGLPCYLSRRQTCELILPADGTPCGDKKYCLQGKCSNFANADNVPETCPFGNSPVADCSNISSNQRLCYEPSILYNCCEECLKVTLPEIGCEFGDRVSSCILEDCLVIDRDYAMVNCCLTCANSFISSTTSQMLDMPPESTTPAQEIGIPISITEAGTTQNTIGLTGDLLQTTEEFVGYDKIPKSRKQNLADSTLADRSESTTMSTVESDRTTDDLHSLTVSEPNDMLISGTRVKRSSTMLITKSFLKTAEPINSPPTAKPATIGYETNVGLGIPTSEGIDITVRSFTESAIPSMVSPNTPNEIPSTTAVGTTSIITEALPSITGTDVTTQVTTATKTVPDVSIASGVIPTPCPTLPARFLVRAWERNLNEINKQFFKKLAISMKARQRNILYGLYGSMQELFQEMNTIIQERQGIEDSVGSGSVPFDDYEILQILVPVWRTELRDILIFFNSRVKQLRYRLLALNKRYIARTP